MELHVFIAFVIATIIMIALPGPSVLLTIAHSISFGWKYGVITVASPSPVPTLFVEKYGSNIESKILGRIPIPVSDEPLAETIRIIER